MTDDINQKIEDAIAADTTLGCGPGTSLGFSTGENDVEFPICVPHDKKDDMIRVLLENKIITHEQAVKMWAENDLFFHNNIERRQKELRFLRTNPGGYFRMMEGAVKKVIYPPIIAVYRYLKGEAQ